MSVLAGLRERASGVVLRALRPKPPVADAPVAPAGGRLGPTPFHPIAPPFGAVHVPSDWTRDPDTGEALPVGAGAALPGVGFLGARRAHRHGWFAQLALQAAAGDAAAAAQANETLGAWLRTDVPGQGLAWCHGTDFTVRLVHWAAGFAWLGDRADPDVLARATASAAWHTRILQARLPMKAADNHRRVAHLAGMVVGGFAFPDAPNARDAWSAGLAGLKDALPAQVAADGGDLDGAPEFLAQSLWLAMLARASARSNGAAFPVDADAALARGVRFLARLAGDLGRLPSLGDAPGIDILAFDDYPLAWSLHHLSLGYRLDEDFAAPEGEHDFRAAILGITPGQAAPREVGRKDTSATDRYRGARARSMPPPPKGWSMWTWRDAGVVAAHLPVKNEAARIVVAATGGRGAPMTHPWPLQVLFEVGEAEVVADPGSGKEAGDLADWIRSPAAHDTLRLADGAGPSEGAITLARVDGKKALVRGTARLGRATWAREVLLNQQRLIVTDSLDAPARVRLTWQLGAGWDLARDGAGWTARSGKLTVVIQLPEALTWEVVRGRAGDDPAGWLVRDGRVVEAPALVGEGEASGDLVTSLEVR